MSWDNIKGGGLAELATRRRVSIGMAAFAMLIFGLIALGELKVNLLPDLSYPTMTVRTEFEGAAPREIENLIAEPMEEALGVIKGVREITSVSRTGMADITLRFAWGTDMDMASLDVREKLEIINLPLEADRPVLLRFNPSTDPVMRMALVGEDNEAVERKFQLNTLRVYAEETLRRSLETLEGVAAVKVSGGLEDEIHIDLDQFKLAQARLTPSFVSKRLGEENINLSAGRLEQGQQRLLVRTINQFQSVAEISKLIISQKNQQIIRLEDVARVYAGHKERSAIIRHNGREGVELAIYKEGDANTVQVADRIKARVERMKKKLPENFELAAVDDQSVFIQKAISEVVSAAVVGGFLAIMIIYLFLRQIIPTLIIAASIPVSVVGTFFLMNRGDISLNIMSLGGIALAVGLLVDNAIVVLENISRLREKGYGVIESAVQGTREVNGAVVASTLTTLAVFVPMAFVEGVAGQLFHDQAMTVAYALGLSMLVALTLIPMLSSLKVSAPQSFGLEREALKPTKTRIGYYLRAIRLFLFWTIPLHLVILVRFLIHWTGRFMGLILRPFAWFINALYKNLLAVYQRALPWSLRNRSLVLISVIALFVVSIRLIPGLGMELVPKLAQGQYNVTLKLAPGSSLLRSDVLMQEIQREFIRIKGIDDVYGVAGDGNRLDANPVESGEHLSRLLVRLDAGLGEREQQQVLQEMRKLVSTFPGLIAEFSQPELFSFQTPLVVELSGQNLESLRKTAAHVVVELGKDERFADIHSSLEQGYPEIQVRFDQERVARLGTTTRALADRVSAQLRGTVPSRYSLSGRKIDMRVQLNESERQNYQDVAGLVINPGSEFPIRLEDVASVTEGEGPAEIRRNNQQRVALISAELASGDLASAVKVAQTQLSKLQLPRGVQLRVRGQSEEMQSSFESLGFALVLAIFLVYLVMAGQFESMLHPFVILFSVPLALIGVILSLMATGTTISIVVLIGLIMLAGIVVNNAIVLVDRINQLREKGQQGMEAIIEAGSTRLRPILMTTMTTVLGMLPMALGLGEGAEVRAPMAVTVIGGLLFSTFLTLLVIPVIYSIFARVRVTQ